jgi:hypothetical protein
MQRSRKCTSIADFANIHFRHNVRLDASKLIGGYVIWLHQMLDEGWEPYLCTFVFHALGGSSVQKREQIRNQITKWYGRLATRTVHDPRSPKQALLLPKGIFVPDLPVFKRLKQSLKDAAVNEGLHMHGIMIANRGGRIAEPLNVHTERNLDKYLVDNIRHIDIRPITDDLAHVVDYALKGLKRPTFSPDDILVLPRTVSELPDR